ncbi:MAG: hypothetical protein ACXW0O_02055 [Methylosarcina sp.]
MIKFYRVTLTDEEPCDLKALINHGKGAARKLTHARILFAGRRSRRRPTTLGSDDPPRY